MSGTDDRADKKLPLTSELGSEGGSYGDPTYQVPTFDQDLEEVGQEAPATEPQGVQSDGSDVRKYPDEEPD